MNKKYFKKLDWKIQTLLVAIFFIVGIIGHSLENTYPLMVILTPFVLLFSGIWAINKSLNKPYMILWILVAYIITFFLEVFGVLTSLIFGPYYYGEVLGLKIMSVPIVIGLNWVIIIFSLVLLSEWIVNRQFKSKMNYRIKILYISLLSAFFATLFDLLMEPTAIKLEYWTWTLTSNPMNIPIQNYIAWFLISFIFALTFLFLPENKRIKFEDSPHSPWFVLIQVIFFISINISITFL